MNYPKTMGVYGPNYTIAAGLYVRISHRGSWEILYKKGGTQRKQTFGKGEEGKFKAIRAAKLLAARLGLTMQREDEHRTFRDAIDKWYNLNVQRWQPGTQERYRGIIRDFLSPLQGLPLEMVDRIRVKQLLVDLLKIRSAKTVEVVHAVISGIFSESIDLGYTDKNPAHGLLKKILPPKNKRRVNAPDPFSQEDLDRMLAAAWAKLPEPLSLILETMAMSGMRLGETLAMTAANLDARNHQYMINETTRHGRFGPPKTGQRLIDLEEGLVLKLESYIKKLQKHGLASGLPVHYLFPGISQRMVQVAMRRACIAARLRARHPHDLRHTYATLLLMAHYSPAYVQKQLGHHSITMTVDIYGHWIPGEGKMDLEGTLRRGVKTKAPRALSVLQN